MTKVWSVCEHPGYTGVFTKDDFEGASFRRGARVCKVNSEPGDAHPDGSSGTVLGSIGVEKWIGSMYGYFIEWDARPKCAVFVMSFKVEGEVA